MGNNNTWLNTSCSTVFIAVSGQWQRVRPGHTVTGSISEATQKDFKLIETPAPVVEKPKKPPVVHTLSASKAPRPSVKAVKKELKRKIKEAGGEYTNFMNVAKLEAVLAGLTK